MTYVHRTFPQVDISLGIKPDYDDGLVEGLETQINVLRGVVVALICILEREGTLSLENAEVLARVKYNYDTLDRLDVENE
jgi:hypothetical protein